MILSTLPKIKIKTGSSTHPIITPLLLSSLITCLLIISGCSTLRPPPQNIPWPQRQAQLKQLKQWEATGSVNLSYNHRTDWGYFTWKKYSTHYQITVIGPMGIEGIKIIGQPHQVVLQQPGHPPLTAQSAEQLMHHALGWTLPITPLQDWIRGLPAPHMPYQAVFDTFQRLQVLNQQGWLIQFNHFTPYTTSPSIPRLIELPTQITLQTNTSTPLKIVLHIKRWHI